MTGLPSRYNKRRRPDEHAFPYFVLRKGFAEVYALEVTNMGFSDVYALNGINMRISDVCDLDGIKSVSDVWSNVYTLEYSRWSF